MEKIKITPQETMFINARKAISKFFPISEILKKHNIPLLTIICLIVFTSCQDSKKEAILGIWRTDSITTFINGLSRTNNVFDSHWSYFEYQNEGHVYERRKKEFRKYNYQLVKQDSLYYSDSLKKITTTYQILHLDPTRLVLKKHQNPFLPGKNQELYEIRYFSKIDAMP